MSELRITGTREKDMTETNFKFSTNLNDIVLHSDSNLKYMIGWNINDVQQECSRKQWILENVDDL